MNAYEYIRAVRGIDPADSIREIGYSLDVDDVIKLMEGYAEEKIKELEKTGDEQPTKDHNRRNDL